MISVIIVTWNSKEFIKQCLESVKKQTEKGIELIVVDNNSKDSTKDIVISFHPDILIENNENAGFSKANNQGINASRGEYIFTLNPDVILEPNFLRQVKKTIETDDKTGMVSGRLAGTDGKIDSQGICLTGIRRFYDIGQGKKIDDKDADSALIGPCAAAGFYRKKMLEEIKIGGEYFDEEFFAYAEDVDLAWRAKKSGWKAAYCGEAGAIHIRGGSGIDLKWKQYLSFRNRYLMIIKNESPLHLLTYLPLFILYDFARLFYMALSNKYFYINAEDIFKLIPKIWKKRNLIRKN